ncbi:hypothetical protein [Arcticibacterium luteifluviistationis]|uniref:G8 domain-containing protein n=1 Tax=Arcticibacterium luteifluviistationis TaxID=1784714 RepID=A0A2Z4GGQ1_9BACT|nr:hypothetical protein [Arcticibacterium luteifluviistationis]AWW00461.1 hypothetical protein DJ013_20680 [Arcticibacterium luteifluviistationis]
MKYLLLLLFSAPVFVGQAQTVTWDGGGGNSDWHNPMNWDTDQLPCNTCTAFISSATVNFSTIDTVGQVVLESGTFLDILANAKLNVFGNSFLVNNSLVDNYGELLCRDYNNAGVFVTYNGVFNNHNAVQVLGSVSSSTEEGVFVLQGSFFNLAGATLNVSGQSSTGLSVQSNGSFYNTGSIFLANCEGAGIWNSGTFENFSAGTINMSFIRFRGIFNESVFRNYGEINVSDINPGLSSVTNGVGLEDNGIFLNSNGANFSVFNSIGIGVLTSGTFTNQGFFKVEDVILDSYSSALGIRVNGDFTNSGEIHILNSVKQGMFLEATTGIRSNTGLIEILNSGTDGLTVRPKFSNAGEILIEDTGGYGVRVYDDTLSNSGELKVSNSQLQGISVDNGFLDNKESGIVTIGNSEGIGLELISLADFRNAGTLNIDTTNSHGIKIFLGSNLKISPDGIININYVRYEGIVNQGSFTNNDGVVTLSNFNSMPNEGRQGIYTSGPFFNDGSINIIDAPATGILVDDGGQDFINNYKILIVGASSKGMIDYRKVENNGTITIKECTKGLVVNFEALLENAGTFNINNCSGTLIDNFGSISNSKNIFLSNSSTFGIVQSSVAILDNLVTGVISIDSCSSDGLENKNVVTNYGEISIMNSPVSINNHGMSASNLFLNKSSGKIHFDGQLINEDDFLNEGLVVQNYALNNTLSEVFQNKGVFVDTKDIQNPSVNFINSGLLLKPLKGETSTGVKEMNIVERTGPTTFLPAKTWYINSLISVPGGVFSSVDNSFTPNLNTIYADTLYFDVTNSSVTHAIKLPIRKVASCPNFPTAIFTQSVSPDWHISANWDTGEVPDYCTIAIIPNAKKSVITSGRKARAHKILSETGSVLDAELGVVLEVDIVP